MAADRTYIIAEIGTSHEGSLNRAAELVNAAASAGADCIKTQIVFADEIIHPATGEVDLPGGRIRLYDRFRELEQDFDFYLRLKELAEQAGLEFLASPFGLKSLEWLLKTGCNSIKIASPELNHFPLLKAAAATGKSIILSSGVSCLNDIEAALNVILRVPEASDENLILLHCITAYPAPEEEYNLKLLPVLCETFGIKTGVSDHSRDPLCVPAIATALGAVCIEKHITLDNRDSGLDDPIALEPDDFKKMVRKIRETEKSPDPLAGLRIEFGPERVAKILGDGIKKLTPSERDSYGRTNRSIHALFELPAGTALTAENTALLRTEKKLRPGIRPEFYDALLGRRLVRRVESGEGISFDDIETG